MTKISEFAALLGELSIGDRLLTLKAHSGLSLAEIADRAGYKAPSSIQKLFSSNYRPARLSEKVAKRLATAFAGTGDPPIKASEVLVMAGGEGRLHEIEEELAVAEAMVRIASQWTGVHETKTVKVAVGNQADVEMMMDFPVSEEGEIFSTPPHLTGRSLIGFRISNSSMWPRFEEGEEIFCQFRPQAQAGDDTLLRIEAPDKEPVYVLGRLLAIEPDSMIINQLQPRRVLNFPRSIIKIAYKVLSRRELLPPRISVKK